MAIFFWDSSAVLKLYHSEDGSEVVQRIFDDKDNTNLISEIALIEVVSGLAKHVRSGEITEADFANFSALFGAHVHRNEFETVALVKEFSALTLAKQLVSDHGRRDGRGLHTLDAIQLATVQILKTEAGFEFTAIIVDRILRELAAEVPVSVIDPQASA
jgi:uncharacterized protein